MRRIDDPAPLTRAQVRALATGAARELGWGLRTVRREHRVWLRQATEIPDPIARQHALAALRDKRPLLDGAALFWILPDRRYVGLLRLLVAFQILANYHDHASERAGAGAFTAAPGSSMETFAQVVDLHRTPDTYSRSTHHHNGGYLAALVDTVRDGCRQLPHYELARPHLVIASHRARSLDLEHVADRRRQAGLLEDFAERAFGPHEHLAWFELTAGSSSMLTAIVALALATRPDTSPNDIAAAVEAYILVATVSALLDNYVDCDDDAASGAHNYLSYYPDFDAGVARLGELVSQTMTAIGRLRYAERHLVIVAAMLAMYLTSDGARSRASSHTSTIANAGGTLTTVLLPILTTWRKINHEGSA